MSTATPGSARTAAAVAARRRGTSAALQRVHAALARLRREKAQVTVAAVARRAGVSRTFLYDNPEARDAVAAAITAAAERRSQIVAAQDSESERSWRERALNAEDALKSSHAEIRTQRSRLGELLGHLRDLEAEQDTESVARLVTDNAALRQRVRQLSGEIRTLDERLAAARTNLRFQDRRIADLQAQIADPQTDVPTAPAALVAGHVGKE
jgi:chromosome segregation ATPase